MKIYLEERNEEASILRSEMLDLVAEIINAPSRTKRALLGYELVGHLHELTSEKYIKEAE